MTIDKPRKIILIDTDAERSNQISHLFEFIEYELCTSSSTHDVQHLLEAGEYLGVFCSDIALGRKIIEGLSDDNIDLPPVVLMLEDNVDFSKKSSFSEKAFATVKIDIKYAELSNLLYRLELFFAKGKSGAEKTSIELFRSLVGASRAINNVRKLIEQVANTDANVLILGDSGTGKEVVARNIHYYSNRRNKPFVPINCGAIPSELLESELFGHEKGAFTGALSARQGRFELAEGGSIFLDEIGDMPLNMQVKLLRVIQEKTFERVGSNKSVKSNVRIIAATHRNLEQLIIEGSFREDLYYRLNVFPVEMPALRNRVEDLPLLIKELVTRLEHETQSFIRLTPAAVAALCQYHWPGNVRELANLMERLSILYPHGIVDVKDLPDKMVPDNINMEELEEDQSYLSAIPLGLVGAQPRLPREGLDLKQHLTEIETSLIRQSLDEADGVVAHAAKRLNIRRTTLVEKMRKYNIIRSEETS